MTVKMKIILSLAFLLSYVQAYANDGAYYASGNHLIPIHETDISVRKEILTLKKVRNKFIEVTVYYEFFNPGEAKNILVGFEAFSPTGDVDGTPKNGLHPYMRDFTVNLNDQILKYQIAYVKDSLYAKSGKIKSQSLDEVTKGIYDQNSVDFYYVYHFDAKFKKGLNTIKHTYCYDLSGSIDLSYDFEYILTAANRWANKQIDDFTLIVDMGEFETFSISKGFFQHEADWLINGIGKVSSVKGQANALIEKDALKFSIQKGNLIFQKKNFKPKGELFLYAVNSLMDEDFDSKEDLLPFSYYQQDRISAPKDELSRKILKNLPFARRGYVFSNPEIRAFYENQEWYIPNPNYVSEVAYLTEEEKRWIELWK